MIMEEAFTLISKSNNQLFAKLVIIIWFAQKLLTMSNRFPIILSKDSDSIVIFFLQLMNYIKKLVGKWQISREFYQETANVNILEFLVIPVFNFFLLDLLM